MVVLSAKKGEDGMILSNVAMLPQASTTTVALRRERQCCERRRERVETRCQSTIHSAGLDNDCGSEIGEVVLWGKQRGNGGRLPS